MALDGRDDPTPISVPGGTGVWEENSHAIHLSCLLSFEQIWAWGSGIPADLPAAGAFGARAIQDISDRSSVLSSKKGKIFLWKNYAKHL